MTSEIGRILIGIILFVFLIGWGVTTSNRVSDLHYDQGVEMNLLNIGKLIFYGFLFIRPIMAVLAIVGLYLKNLVGWIFMNAFFYFIAFDLVFVGIPKMSNGLIDYLGVLIVLSPVILSNTGTVRRQFKVTRNWIVNANLASLCLGIVTAFAQGYYVANSGMGYWEILEKLK